jgi:peptidoglycan/LPS O-acetylase OafA/YrhL
MTNRAIYFPGLNGIRAIAATAVIFSHVTLHLADFGLDPFILGKQSNGWPQGLALANYGVSLFFVLSGFLITYLLSEEKQSGSVDIKKFYARRVLRIFPLYYLYLAIALVATVATGERIGVATLLYYVFYAANVPFLLKTTLRFLEHYWSLGVEEQFYALYPWLHRRVGDLAKVSVVFIGSVMAVKLFLHFRFPHTLLEEMIGITRFHCMMIGALGATLYRAKHLVFLKLADNKLTQSVAWFVMLLVAINRYHIASVIDHEIISVVALLIMIGQINMRNRLVNLETPLLDYLGKISYGLYVIHPVIIYPVSKCLYHVPLPSSIKYVSAYLLTFAVAVLAAHLSYNYFEKYFMNKKKNFEVVKSSAIRLGEAA